MITIVVQGGLGNQMFQYAAAKALAEQHGVGVVIEVSSVSKGQKRGYMLDHLQVPDKPVAQGAVGLAVQEALKWRGRAARLLEQSSVNFTPQLPGTYSERHFHFDPAFFNQGQRIRLYGYFQSELYFVGIADKIRGVFQPRESLSAAALEMARQIDAATLPVSVHVRRGDYVSLASIAKTHGILDAAYYRRALRLMAGLIGSDATLFVFSDDPEAAAEMIAALPARLAVVVRGDPARPWEDMRLMARCRHHVIANSSFSWWGAWLNPSPDKIVIGPRQWFQPLGLRRYNLCDLYPAGWILI